MPPAPSFSTLTNVNFDSPRIVGYARQAIALREALKAQCPAIDASAAVDSPVADLQLVSDDLGDLQRQAADYTPNKDKAAIGENISRSAPAVPVRSEGCGGPYGARPRARPVRQRYLCPVP